MIGTPTSSDFVGKIIQWQGGGITGELPRRQHCSRTLCPIRREETVSYVLLIVLVAERCVAFKSS